jgi:hypothetical protein
MKDKLRLETLLNFYFNLKNESIEAAINRAYRDFNRTVPLGKNETKTERDYSKKIIVDLLNKKIEFILKHKFKTQKEFDSYHKETCLELKKKWNKLTFGQIQKWVNMSLKYCLIIGEKRIKGINKNYHFYHIPIDRIILEKIFDEKNHIVWSKINEYNLYFQYQIKFRVKHPKEIPIIYETNLFNMNVNS